MKKLLLLALLLLWHMEYAQVGMFDDGNQWIVTRANELSRNPNVKHIQLVPKSYASSAKIIWAEEVK